MEKQFRTQHSSDLTHFSEKIDTLQMLVGGLSSHSDLNKCEDISNEIKKTSNMVDDLLKTSSNTNTILIDCFNLPCEIKLLKNCTISEKDYSVALLAISRSWIDLLLN